MTPDNHILSVALGIINFLSLLLIAMIGFFLKSLWEDIKQLKQDVTILETEHRLHMAWCSHESHQKPT